MADEDTSLPPVVQQPWAAAAQATAADTQPPAPPIENAVAAAGAPLTTAPEAPVAEVPPAPPVAAISESETVTAADDEVTVIAPKSFILRENGQEVHVQSGIQQMKTELAEHWYSKAQGVQIYKK